VVIGTGESAAAQHDNRQLATAFLNAWATHAQGRPPIIDDVDYKDEAQRGRHLIVIGNTRSNNVLAGWAKNMAHFPITWDARQLSVEGKNWLRSEQRPVCLTWPHPANDGRLLIILDGSARWLQPGLPLSQVPELAIGGVSVDDPPEIWRNFDNNWR
jgi:hypothetical protein